MSRIFIKVACLAAIYCASVVGDSENFPHGFRAINPDQAKSVDSEGYSTSLVVTQRGNEPARFKSSETSYNNGKQTTKNISGILKQEKDGNWITVVDKEDVDKEDSPKKNPEQIEDFKGIVTPATGLSPIKTNKSLGNNSEKSDQQEVYDRIERFKKAIAAQINNEDFFEETESMLSPFLLTPAHHVKDTNKRFKDLFKEIQQLARQFFLKAEPEGKIASRRDREIIGQNPNDEWKGLCKPRWGLESGRTERRAKGIHQAANKLIKQIRILEDRAIRELED